VTDPRFALQAKLAGRVRVQPLDPSVRLVAGADCCYARGTRACVAAVAVWDLRRAQEVETRTLLAEAAFPYVPGLFAFREAPPILKALSLLARKPEVLICDGHGAAHPRRFGLACHVGVLAGLPTIGCARGLLCGSFAEPGPSRGSRSPLVDRGETIGSALRTQNGVRPVFVSVGHLADLPSSERLVLSCAPRWRLPEPLRLAHRAAAEGLRAALGAR
jgi:deoxyribonuclease V